LPGSGSRADQCAQQGGHSRLAVTLEIYTHADEQAQREALTRLHDLFDRTSD
jgi:integrase